MKLHKLLNIGLLTITPIICTTSITACGPKGEEDDPTKCKLTLDANGGLYDDGETTSSLKVGRSSYYSQIQDTIKKPTKNLYKFKAYSLDKVNPIESSYRFDDASATLYALWEKETTVNVTFDANGGSFEQSSIVTKELVYGTLLKDVQLNEPTHQGYTFNGWTIDQEVVLDENYALKTNATLKANWLDQTNTVSVTIDKNLETSSTETIDVPKGTIIKNLSSSYSRTGYVFRCFGYTNGEQISNNFIVKDPLNIKIWWKSDGTSEEESAQDYIYNRSFSITDNTESGIGTCWILADATPNDLADFQYYIATNLHVRVALETQTTTGYKFTDTKDVIKLGETEFTDFYSFDWEAKSLFTYDQSKPEDAIDLSIAKADFRNATGTTKTKLTNLNTRQSIEGCITEFVDAVSESKHYETISVASTAGYGATATGGYQWEFHPYLQLEFVYNYSGHSTNDPIYSNDASPQYRLKGTEELGWMRPGSSGSMLVGKDTDNTWKVLGIYWGGTSTIPGGTTGIPYFSCFNSDKKNFIDSYCTYHLNY